MRRRSRFAAVLAWLAILGCEEGGGGSGADPAQDADADGYPVPVDCNDASAAIHPGAEERCNRIDEDCDGAVDEEPPDAPIHAPDADGDGHGRAGAGVPACEPPAGYVQDETDCDDADPAVHPGAQETCDGVDQDCDGGVDESPVEAPSWHPDADGDGVGATGGAVSACTAPEGHVALPGDCDDADPAVHPGADEACDGVDQDCDGTADEGTPGLSAFHPDADEDGHGDPGSVEFACEPPPGTVADGSDCNDSDPTIHPGAEDACGNLRDDDCDGEVDEESPGAGWYLDADGDGFGGPATPAHPCSSPPDDAVADGTDCDDGRPDVHPGASESCEDGLDGDCDGRDPGCGRLGEIDLDLADGLIVGQPYDMLEAVAPAGDVDGDGYGDVVLGAPVYDKAYLVLGPVTGRLDLAEAEMTFGPSTGPTSTRLLGESVAGAGDLDRDGFDDLLVGDPEADEGGSAAGTVYVVFGPAYGAVEPEDAGATLAGSTAGEKAGYSVAGAGDVDGDGNPDVLIGAPYSDDFGKDAGLAYVMLGPIDGDRSLGGAAARLVPEAAGDRAGHAVAPAGDVNGDGYGDVLVSAYGSDAGGGGSGRAYLAYGPLEGDVALATAGATFTGGGEGAWLTSVAGAGDTNGDGYDDVIVGAWGGDEEFGGQGVAYLFQGPVAADVTLRDASAVLVGEHWDDHAGQGIGAGDVNGDGFADVLVGAPYSDAGGESSGAGYLLYGPLAGTIDLAEADARFVGERASDQAGSFIAGSDLDGDGFDDVLAFAPGSDHASGGGAVYVVRGGLAEDLDGDGLSAHDGDCVDRDPLAHPGGDEACNGIDDDCDGTIDEGPDADGDGFSVCDGDCDDGDPAVWPGAADVCNGVDDDCDGRPDPEDDADGDGWAPCVGDCDDADWRVHPGAMELCDGVDADCDGVLGEAPDLDEDGSAVCDGDCDDADPAVGPGTEEACDGVDQDCDGIADDGYDTDADFWTTCEGDCDDGSSSVYPGADEGCDGVDSDCDGEVDEGAHDDADGDGFTVCDGDCDDGNRYEYAGSPHDGCPGDGCEGEPDDDGDGWSACEGDCDDADPAFHPGAPETCGDGIDHDCDPARDRCAPEGSLALSDLRSSWEGAGYAGTSLAAVGDLDGDGVPDLAVGHADGPNDYYDSTNPGCAWIVPGPFDLGQELEVATYVEGSADGDEAGTSVAGPGDVDGDGFADLVIGAPKDDWGGGSAGAAYLIRGPVTTDLSVTEADGAWLGEDDGDSAGTHVAAAGDVDGDGLADFLVSAPSWSGEGSYTGAAYLVLGPGLGAASLAWADARWTGQREYHGLEFVAGAGDVNADGYGDVLLGAEWDDTGGSYAGAVFLFYGPVHGDLSLDDADARLIGPGEMHGAGRVAGAGDVNGDGYADILVGGPFASPSATYAGSAWLVHGPVWGDLGLDDADARFDGAAQDDRLGMVVAGVGDVDGDGLDDLAFGLPYHDGAASSAGAVWLVYAPVSGTHPFGSVGAVLHGSESYDGVGTAVARGGDLDGDGYDDVLVSSPSAEREVTVVPGGRRP